MKPIRVAAASTDGLNVDEHFGKADRFLIFDVTDQATLVAERPTETLSVGDPDHPFDPDRFGRIAGLLKDCAKVYVTRIGERPAKELSDLGIEPVVYQGAIADIGKGL